MPNYIEPNGGSTEGDKTIQAHLREACEHKIALHADAAIDVVDTDPVEAEAWAYEAGKEAWDFDLKAPEKLVPYPLLNAAFKRGFDSVEQGSPKREVHGNVEHATHNRYALAVQDAEAGLIWSVGGVWSASLLSQPPALMTGPEVDALHKKHPNAHIVDVIVYREACEAYNAGFNAVLNHDERSTPESRQAARNAGIESLVRAGFPENALEIGRNDYLQQGNGKCRNSS